MKNFPSDQTRNNQLAHARGRTQFPVSGKSVAKIEKAGGMPAVCLLILEGHTVREIAERIGVPRSDLSAWQHNVGDPAYDAAMRQSAESCLDMAEHVLDMPGEPSMARVSLAKEKSAIWRHRAAVRDSRYSPKGATIDIAPVLPAVPSSFVIKIMPGTAREEKVIENDPA